MVTGQSQSKRQGLKMGDEQAILHSLLQAAKAAGIQTESQAIINGYISLKSRPFLILAGEKQTGKVEFIKCLGQILMENPTRQCQLFVAHARWAAKSQDIGRFVEMQARFNRNKLLALIEEACQPENRNNLYIACLARLSPAELFEYFSVAGFRFWPDQHNETSAAAMMPIPYPPNFRLIGTLDTARFIWWDADLLSHTTVIQWPGAKIEGSFYGNRKSILRHSTFNFLQTCVHSERRAYARLGRFLQGYKQAFLPLMQVLATLEHFNVTLPHEVIKRVVIYLVNAWTEQGEGLFDPLPRHNLNLALDYALVQFVLPWIMAFRRDPERVLVSLAELFDEQFRHTSAFIQTWSGKATRPINYQPNYA